MTVMSEIYVNTNILTSILGIRVTREIRFNSSDLIFFRTVMKVKYITN